jgi:ATP-dependent Zn protease
MDDLEKVTQSAYSQVLQLGFSERVGLVGYRDQADLMEEPMYSDATARIADEEVRSLVAEV